jgi:hypothetical protein
MWVCCSWLRKIDTPHGYPLVAPYFACPYLPWFAGL